MNLLTYLNKRKFTKTFLLLLGLVFIVLLSYRIAINLREAPLNSTSLSKIAAQPSPTPTIIITQAAAPNPRDILLERKQNRIPLSESDQQVKAALLQLLPPEQNAGVIYETPTYRVEYIEALDLLKIEILNTNIDSVKAEGTNWFRTQGMSLEGICNAPLSFYLNFKVRTQLGSNADTFNPLPPGC